MRTWYKPLASAGTLIFSPLGKQAWMLPSSLKLSNNGGVDAATEQMKAKQYAEPFKADKRKVIALAIELDDMGKGLVDWKEV